MYHSEGKHSTRPVGDAGRGRHTGKTGWLGGKHRRSGDGCRPVLAVPVLGLLLALILTACGDNDAYARQRCNEVHADRVRISHVTKDTTAYECICNHRLVRTIVCASKCSIR